MSEADKPRLGDAVRAGWLYYITGKTQDEIAQMLGVSRPTAQRLVALCRSEGLVTLVACRGWLARDAMPWTAENGSAREAQARP